MPNFGLSKPLPDTGRLTRQVMFARLLMELHKVALPFLLPRLNHIADIQG
jgi:hypothetical protein